MLHDKHIVVISRTKVTFSLDDLEDEVDDDDVPPVDLPVEDPVVVETVAAPDPPESAAPILDRGVDVEVEGGEDLPDEVAELLADWPDLGAEQPEQLMADPEPELEPEPVAAAGLAVALVDLDDEFPAHPRVRSDARAPF